MAITKSLRDVKITVEVDGQNLQEHRDQGENPDKSNEITRFIAAESEKNFQVVVEAEFNRGSRGTALDIEVMVDGELTEKWIMKNPKPGKRKRRRVIHKSSGIALPHQKFAKYKFASIDQVSDGHAMKDEVARLSKFGMIEVCVWACDISHRTRSAGKETYQQPKGLGVVSEKALKGQNLSHSVEFEDAAMDEDPGEYEYTFEVKRLHPKRTPHSKVIFCYRSLEALKSMLIVPRTPSPQPEVPLEERDFTTLNADELRELQQRVAAMRTQPDNVKREHTEDEEAPPPRKRARPSEGDTQLEIDDEGGFRQVSTAGAGRKEMEIIELD